MKPRSEIESWVSESPDNLREFRQEMFILEVTQTIWDGMLDQGITRSELAKRLGRTRGYVSHLLSGDRNLTLRTLSDIAHAIGYRAKFDMSEGVFGDFAGWQPDFTSISIPAAQAPGSFIQFDQGSCLNFGVALLPTQTSGNYSALPAQAELRVNSEQPSLEVVQGLAA